MPKLTARTEFAAALNQVCTERGISLDSAIETIKSAIFAAYRKDREIEDDTLYETEIDPETGEAKIYEYADETKKKKKDVTPPNFGRIAAQAAKQVFLQKIRETEKNAIIEEYEQKIGQIINGMVLRFNGSDIICDIGRGQGILPPSEQIRNESYNLNKRLTFYILDIVETKKGRQIIVSRATPKLVEKLFKREVPEIASKAVEIKIVAREAGNRSKVAVLSKQSGVDPVGSCVGQKGVRVKAVIDELGGEKLDIIQYSEDPVKFISAALAPAESLKVEIDKEKKIAKVTAPQDQLSLAIGKDGQNVRLAAKICGFKIDIVGLEEKKKAVKEEKPAKKTDKEKTKKTKKKDFKKDTKKKTKKAKAKITSKTRKPAKAVKKKKAETPKKLTKKK